MLPAPKKNMKLWLEVSKDTKKKNWDNKKCGSCNYRFSCFSGNEIVVEPDQLDIKGNTFVAVFSIPLCLRVGLFKQLPDSWYSSNYRYGKVIDTRNFSCHATITLKPPTIRLDGRIY